MVIPILEIARKPWEGFPDMLLALLTLLGYRLGALIKTDVLRDVVNAGKSLSVNDRQKGRSVLKKTELRISFLRRFPASIQWITETSAPVLAQKGS